MSNVRSGAFLPTYIGYSDKSTTQQAEEILNQVDHYHKQGGYQKVGITYSANNDQVVDQISKAYGDKSKWRTGVSGSNQAAVMAGVEHLLNTPKYAHLQGVFEILPVTTCAHSGGSGEVEQKWLDRDFRNIESFMSNKHGLVLAWQNEDANETLDKKFGVGGSISQQLIKRKVPGTEQTQEEFVQEKLNSYRKFKLSNDIPVYKSAKPAVPPKPKPKVTEPTKPLPKPKVTETATVPSDETSTIKKPTPKKEDSLEIGDSKSNTTRSNFLLTEKIEVIKKVLPATTWQVKDAQGEGLDKHRVVANLHDETKSFRIYAHQMRTQSATQDTYDAMLLSFKKVNPGQNPLIRVNDETVIAKWHTALSKAGFEPPEKFVKPMNPPEEKPGLTL